MIVRLCQHGSGRRLLLWDVDGTLIRGGGVGSDAIHRAAAMISRAVIADGTVAMHGKTDPQILTEILRAAAVAEHDISRLLPDAMAETERQLALAEHDLRRRGEHYRADEVWVIGDTPADLACARAAGVHCLLVATGQFPMSELRALDADAVLDDLTGTERVVDILTGR